MLKVEFQFVSKCPIVKEMERNLKSAISDYEFKLDYSERILVNDDKTQKTRGCPTLLVIGRDLIGAVECNVKKAFCRTYNNGIPTVEELKRFIELNY